MGSSKIENYIQAVERLSEALLQCGDVPDSLLRDGVIQRFEFCTELAWKSLRQYLTEQGFADINSPKAVMREAYSYGVINGESIWISILNDRNLTAHIYDEKQSVEIFQRIKSDYILAFEELKAKYIEAR